SVFFFKQKTAYEMVSDWSSDVCSSDLRHARHRRRLSPGPARAALVFVALYVGAMVFSARIARDIVADAWRAERGRPLERLMVGRSEERRVGKRCGAGWSVGRLERKERW